jgi:hypothetical protein
MNIITKFIAIKKRRGIYFYTLISIFILSMSNRVLAMNNKGSKLLPSLNQQNPKPKSLLDEIELLESVSENMTRYASELTQLADVICEKADISENTAFHTYENISSVVRDSG